MRPEEWQALLQWFTSENSVTISVMTDLEDNSTTINTVPGKFMGSSMACTCYDVLSLLFAEVCDECSRRWKPAENDLESATFVYVYHLKDSDNEEEVRYNIRIV